MSLQSPTTSFVCLPPTVDMPLEGAVQKITLLHNGKPAGHALWHAHDGGSGVVQLLECLINTEIRRQRHGTRLVREVMKQCVSHLRSRKVRARRLWVAVEQRNQVIARAFLTHMGFHHTSTIRDLLSDQDVLVYVYSFD